MTQPAPAPTIQGEEVPDAEALAFEAAAVVAVTGVVATAVTALLASLYAAWELVTLPADRLLFGRTAAARIRSLSWAPMVPRLQKVAVDARDLGVDRAVRRFPAGPERDQASATNWRASGVLPAVPDVDRETATHLLQAARMAERLPFDRKGDVHAVAGRVRQGLSRAQATARYAANEGINAGTAEVARTMGLRLLWVAERNACLDCLAHAGWAVNPGAMFPAGLTFDPLRVGRVRAVAYPPLHPNCRCQVRTYDGPAGKPPADRSRVDPAARVYAEARRSVVYQWTDYASGAAARRAAEALLQAGADLPRTVEQRARTALRSGRPVRRPR